MADTEFLHRKESFLSQALKALEKEVRAMSARNNEGFIKCFNDIEDLPSAKSSISTKAENKRSNRYNNIIAYDHSRVKVTPNKANGNNDYLNANFLKGLSGKDTYIATQAPVPESFSSFWQMIWEQGITVIVMVTNEVEGGKLKCHRYWPDQKDDTIKAGDFHIQFSFQEVFPTHVKRTFSLTHKKSGEEFGQINLNPVYSYAKYRDIRQFAFTAWPDHGVPATTQELLEFRSEVRKSWTPSKGKVAVHCSAGVGRTGTFIALDRFFEGIENGHFVRLLDIVKNLRSDRNFMVQSQIQFIYLYHICLDGIHDILLSVQRALRSTEISEFDQNEEQLMDIQDMVDDAADLLDGQIDEGDDMLDEQYRNDPSRFSRPLAPKAPKKKVVEFSYSVGKYTDDIGRAARLTAAQRRASLLEIGGAESEFWRSRRNVPLSLQDKGYYNPKLHDLSQRLKSLDEHKSNWRKRYETARVKWEQVMDEGGEVYDITRQMTPLESRLESLANMEDAWKYRGDGFRSAREEDVRRTLAGLTQRLQSLQETILSAEARWRAKGDGMRQKQVLQEGTRVHTTDRLGGLMDRLELLQEEELAWIRRDNQERFDRSKFDRDVRTERNAQQQQEQQRKGIEDEKRKQEELAAAQKQASDDARMRKESEERSELERRESVKEKMKQSSIKGQSFDPEKERTLKQKQKEDDERTTKEELAKAQQSKQAEAAKVEAKKKEAEDAKQLAAKFIGKLKA